MAVCVNTFSSYECATLTKPQLGTSSASLSKGVVVLIVLLIILAIASAVVLFLWKTGHVNVQRLQHRLVAIKLGISGAFVDLFSSVAAITRNAVDGLRESRTTGHRTTEGASSRDQVAISVPTNVGSGGVCVRTESHQPESVPGQASRIERYDVLFQGKGPKTTHQPELSREGSAISYDHPVTITDNRKDSIHSGDMYQEPCRVVRANRPQNQSGHCDTPLPKESPVYREVESPVYRELESDNVVYSSSTQCNAVTQGQFVHHYKEIELKLSDESAPSVAYCVSDVRAKPSTKWKTSSCKDNASRHARLASSSGSAKSETAANDYLEPHDG